jgi:hypothetical protein
MRTTGSCLCGAVRFDIEGAFDAFYLSHCGRCRKDSGTAHAANLFASKARLLWRQGEDTVRTFRLPDTRHARAFCVRCGSAMPYASEGFVVVPAGSLDTPLAIAPQAHLFLSCRAEWERRLEEIRGFEGLPSADEDDASAAPRSTEAAADARSQTSRSG